MLLFCLLRCRRYRLALSASRIPSSWPPILVVHSAPPPTCPGKIPPSETDAHPIALHVCLLPFSPSPPHVVISL